MSQRQRGQAYQPLTLTRLARLLIGSDGPRRWRLIAEFLEEYRWEPPDTPAELTGG